MTDLTDRMRTCAAHILHHVLPGRGDEPRDWQNDAADLLIEASNALEACIATGEACVPLGEPMEIIEAKPARSSVGHYLPDNHPASPVWIDPGGALPTVSELTPLKRSPRACPKCDSRANKRVVRLDSKLMLVCPVCSTQWEWKR